MTDFSVWAPTPDRVRMWTSGAEGERIHDLRRGVGGWWHAADLEALDQVEDYAYLLGDDETRIPDPRSRRQPRGVHEPSRVVAAGPPTGDDAAWRGREPAGSVIYELHIGTFTPDGTFDGAIGKLDYLANLGIDFVELLPVNAFNGMRGWGYDGVLWFAVHEPYGAPTDTGGSSTRVTPTASASSKMSCTTTSARAGTTCPDSAPTCPAGRVIRGANRSIWTVRAPTKCGATSLTTR